MALAIVGLAALVPAAQALSPDRTLAQMQHTAWTAREGAPQGIASLAQTEDGFLWLGALDGLYRFDGIRFTRHTGQSGDPLPQDTARAIVALPGNGLMVGWQLGGVSLLRRGHVVHVPPGKDFPPGSVRQLAMAPDGSVWAAVRGGLARYADGRWEWIGSAWGFTGKTAHTIFVDRNGSVAVKTERGLELLAPGEHQFHQSPDQSASDGVWMIGRAPDGTLYVSDARGIRPVASLASREQAELPVTWKNRGSMPGFPAPFSIDSAGNLWVATFRQGIDRVSFPARSSSSMPSPLVEHFDKRDGLAGGYGCTFLEDREGNVWIATYEGLNRFRETRFVAAQPTTDLVADTSMLAVEDGAMLLSMLPGGTVRIDKSGRAIPFLAAVQFVSAHRAASGDILFASSNYMGNARWVLGRLSRGRVEGIALPPGVPPQAEAQSLTQDAQGGLWVSFPGLGVYRQLGGEWTQPVPGGPALFVHAAADGSVWMAYVANRVVRWRAGEVQEFSGPQGLQVGNARALQSDGARTWIGGDEGLCVHEGARIRCLASREQDALRGIRGVAVTPEGALWVGTARGAVWIEAQEVRRALQSADGVVACHLFDAQDGIVGVAPPLRPVPSVVLSTGGRPWIATSHGAFVADPAGLARSPRLPPVVIEALQAGDSRIAWPESVKLEPRAGQLRIEYTALALSVPQRTRFRYRLDGVDTGWQDAGNRREATYTQLGPGSYRFHVIASNEDGVWNETGAQLDFTVKPAFFETVWFKALCALMVIAALALLYRVRVGHIRRQFQARFQERLIERERIARELHDTLLQSVQGLILRCQAAMVRLPKTEPARDMLEAALVQADDVLNEGRDRINDLRLADAGQDAFENGLRQAGAELVQPHDVRFEMIVQGTSRRLHPLVAEAALRIAREAISNAVRHAGTPRIEVDVIYAADGLRLHVRDEGKGIPPAVLEAGGVNGHWGLSGMQERAQLMGAKLQVWSRQEAGTEVELRIPAAAAYMRDGAPESATP